MIVMNNKSCGMCTVTEGIRENCKEKDACSFSKMVDRLVQVGREHVAEEQSRERRREEFREEMAGYLHRLSGGGC
jgi:hypothetical protein